MNCDYLFQKPVDENQSACMFDQKEKLRLITLNEDTERFLVQNSFM